jgi:hypothetical protein
MASSPLIRDSVVSLIVMALLPSSSWCCGPCGNGIFVIIDAQASLPSSRWHYCPCCNGVLAVDVQASLPSLQWQLLPSLQWHLCHSQASLVIKLALLPS